MSSAPKTAIVTGACSGIGLSIAHSLLTRQWRVVFVDINPTAYDNIKSTLDPNTHIFVQADVASWDSQAALFKKAYEWSNHQLDFFAANAGIGDREFVTQPFDLDAEPAKPDLACLDVNIVAVFYGLKLFIHYARKTRRALGDSHESFNPKMVITASCAGQYPFPIACHYAASKAACVNLTRSAAPTLYKHDNLALNCIMPAFLATSLPAKELIDAWPKEYLTPTSTADRAIEELTSENGRVAQDGKSDGKDGEVKFGQSVEVVLDRLYYRTHVEFADESQKFLISEAYEGGLWERVYTDLARKGMVGISDRTGVGEAAGLAKAD